jgi:inorganic pyrophosphatase
MAERSKKPLASGEDLPAFDAESGNLNAIIDTPKGSHNKYKFDREVGLFRMKSVLPAGAVFPYDFGDIPSTLGEDGDPVDVLVLMEEPAFVGCLLEARLVGVVEAEQTEEGKTERNDRLIAVAVESRTWQDVRTIGNLPDALLAEIEHFFVSYNRARGKEFRPIARRGPKIARRLVEQGEERFRRSRRSKG